MSAPTAAALARVDAAIPPDAEVIASIGVVGRFAARAEVYPFGIPFRGGETVPVGREPVYFVFVDRANGVGVKPKVTEDAIRDLRARGARTVAWDNEVVALMWTPPPDTHYIRFADT